MRAIDLRKWLIGGVLLVVIASASLISVPNLPERLEWRWQQLWSGLRRTALRLPETLPTPAALSTAAPTPGVEPPPAPVAVSEPTLAAMAAAPLPEQMELNGVAQVWQKVNNCGPATLAMALSYWGWKGTQANTANALKPNPDDRNVSPAEMAAYVQRIGLGAEVRLGGDLTLVRRLVAAGFPVILETSILLPDQGWEGHYTLVTGYSETRRQFTTQDSLRGPNFVQSYDDVAQAWRAFNYVYVVLHPPERRAEVLDLVGADPVAAVQHAADLARAETQTLSGQDLAFAWFNLGTSLAALGDWPGAVQAYDQARIAGLPWRMLWYQHGPLEAYFSAGRPAEVLALADATLAQADGLEEVLYWRGQARLAQGDRDGAQADWRAALAANRNYAAPAQALAQAGMEP